MCLLGRLDEFSLYELIQNNCDIVDVQVAYSCTYELRPYLDLLLQMLLLEDSWQNHRIHNALKGQQNINSVFCRYQFSLSYVTYHVELFVRILMHLVGHQKGIRCTPKISVWRVLVTRLLGTLCNPSYG